MPAPRTGVHGSARRSAQKRGPEPMWFRAPSRVRYAPTLTRAKPWIVMPAFSAAFATDSLLSFA